MEKNSITQFTDKYTKTGSIGNFLVGNFFKSLGYFLNKAHNVENVLEVGCGAGYSMEHIKNSFHSKTSFTACDIDPELVDLTKAKNPEVSCDVASIYELPYENKSYDLVLCLEVLEHLDNPELALSELARVTKGHIVISTPNEPMWRMLNCLRLKYIKDFGNTPGHINHWSSQELKKLVSKYFDIIEMKNPLPWNMIYAKNKNNIQ